MRKANYSNKAVGIAKEKMLIEDALERYKRLEKIKEIHQYPLKIQQSIKIFLNIFKIKLSDIEDVIVSNAGDITIKDKFNKFLFRFFCVIH